MAVVTNPSFSVVIATAERGTLIEATLESVERQSVEDIEVIVVSDGPVAAGLATAVNHFGQRFRLLETTERCGSQFAPNNRGWEVATGRFIAYLGHDDIWLPEHLAALMRAFEQQPDADFAASGCLYFGPPGSGPGHTWVTGLFDPSDRRMALTHFFPPSSVAHRRELPEDMRWPDAALVRRPVDSQFMLTAAHRGCVFTSTRTITVLKFNSAMRYLSYLSPDDHEQRAALAVIDDPQRLADHIGGAADDAALSGNYMTTCHPSERDREPGEPVRLHAVIRGIDTPVLEPLVGPTWLPLGDDPRAFDWHALETNGEQMWRWSGPNPRPRLLVPFTNDGPVRFALHTETFATDDVRESLEVLLDRRPVDAVIRRVAESTRSVIEFDGTLLHDRPSVIELRMNRTVLVAEFVPGSSDARRLGLSLSGVHLEPLSGVQSSATS